MATSLVHLLFVEHDSVSRELFKLQCDHLGYTCDLVENAPQAFERLEQRTYQLMLMACRLPYVDGVAAARCIRESGKAWSNIPIIAVSTDVFGYPEEVCLNAGMNSYLIKPYTLEQLAEVIACVARLGPR